MWTRGRDPEQSPGRRPEETPHRQPSAVVLAPPEKQGDAQRLSSARPLRRKTGIHLADRRSMDAASASSHDLPRPMLRPEAYAHAADDLQIHETHISWVILAGPYA